MTVIAERVRQHREKMRSEGLRPVQLWVPDSRNPDFLKECRRQSRLAARADKADKDLHQFLDQALEDVEGWTA